MDETQGAFEPGAEAVLPGNLNFSLSLASHKSLIFPFLFLTHDCSTAFGPEGMTLEAWRDVIRVTSAHTLLTEAVTLATSNSEEVSLSGSLGWVILWPQSTPKVSAVDQQFISCSWDMLPEGHLWLWNPS